MDRRLVLLAFGDSRVFYLFVVFDRRPVLAGVAAIYAIHAVAGIIAIVLAAHGEPRTASPPPTAPLRWRQAPELVALLGAAYQHLKLIDFICGLAMVVECLVVVERFVIVATIEFRVAATATPAAAPAADSAKATGDGVSSELLHLGLECRRAVSELGICGERSERKE